MRIASGVVDQYVYFVALDATDLATRETGLSSFTVYRSRNGGAAAAMTTPTINETDSSNMPGVYELLLDEDMTIDAGDETQEMVFHITHAGMAPVTRAIELYRPKITAGNTLSVESDGDLTKVNTLDGHTAQTGDSFARLGAPAGASVSADIAAIEAQTDDIGVAGAGLTAVPWNTAWDAEVESEVADALNAYDPPTNAEMVARTLAAAAYFDAATDTVTVGTNNDKSGYSISGTKTTLDALQDLSAAQVNAEADTALADIHLDHLLAADYDPAAKPGTATALLNELVESDAGVSRFTANALEEAPAGGGGGGDATEANQLTIIGHVDELETRLTAARAGYLDNLNVGGVLNNLSAAQVDAEVDEAIENYRLNELMAAALASQPVAGSLLGDLTQDDGGTQQFSVNALENAPGGGAAMTPQVLLDTTISSATSQTEFVLVAGSDVDGAYDGETIVFYDVSNSNYPSRRQVVDYVGATRTITIDAAPNFTVGAADAVKIFVSAAVVHRQGDIEFTYTLTDVMSGDPIANATIEFSTEADMSHIVWIGSTDAFGVARDLYGNLPFLDPGTYTIRARHTEYTFDLDTEVVS